MARFFCVGMLMFFFGSFLCAEELPDLTQLPP